MMIRLTPLLPLVLFLVTAGALRMQPPQPPRVTRRMSAFDGIPDLEEVQKAAADAVPQELFNPNPNDFFAAAYDPEVPYVEKRCIVGRFWKESFKVNVQEPKDQQWNYLDWKEDRSYNPTGPEMELANLKLVPFFDEPPGAPRRKLPPVVLVPPVGVGIDRNFFNRP